jgi:hypothetical protein
MILTKSCLLAYVAIIHGLIFIVQGSCDTICGDTCNPKAAYNHKEQESKIASLASESLPAVCGHVTTLSTSSCTVSQSYTFLAFLLFQAVLVAVKPQSQY